MTVASFDTGAKTMDGTEQTLTTTTTAGVYVLFLDLNVLADGDTLEVRQYCKTRTGSTSRQVGDTIVYQHAQGAGCNVYLPPLSVAWEAHWTLKQTAGTNRTIDWSVFSH